MSATEWLRLRHATPTPAVTEAADRAPWVPAPTTVAHPAVETQRLKTAFQRDQHCPVCAYRYSRCYCAAGDDRA